MYIENISSPKDLKKLDISQCEKLAEEIRFALIKKASLVGGHLASNLGVVELTIAMHYVFDSPHDKFIFDVSHQCYTHKVLTGRAESFINPDKYKQVSGYTCPAESEHDYFQIGHTATAISLACGLAKGRDAIGGTENIIAVIGDGSLGGGEALEGLNFGGSELRSNLIVVFNDNQMSIAENHGGMYGHFEELRKTKGESENNLFKSFGYDYLFVEDGHDLNMLISAFNSVKDSSRPTVVHICTTKGKGYQFSEQNKEGFHWAKPFDVLTGAPKTNFNGERYDKIVRDYLKEKMTRDPKVIAAMAAVPDSLAFNREFRDEMGSQFVDVGIAEEHAIAMIAGIAKAGAKPVFVTLSTFYQRTYDQISQELCINSLPATMIVANASVYAVNDITHIGIFDIAMMSNIPRLVYLAPTNCEEYLAMLDWSIEQTKYPVAIRAPRNGVFHSPEKVSFGDADMNKFKYARNGNKVAIIALGDFFQMGEQTAELLEKEAGITPTLINPRFITGLDTDMLNELPKKHDIIITLEDGVLEGGFGQKIASFYGIHRELSVLNYGLKKEFIDRYNVDKVLAENRLTPELIVKDILELIS